MMRHVSLAKPADARTIEGWCVVCQWFGKWQATICRDRAQAEHILAETTNLGVPATVLHDGLPA